MAEAATDSTAVLLMGYGSPSGAADLPGYLAEVLGRPPTEEMVQEYVRRYELIGGSPQNRILQSIRDKLEARFRRDGENRRVFLGTKHWKPNLADVLPAAVSEGYHRFIAIPLSPYASTWILEPYRSALAKGIQSAGGRAAVDLRVGWHLDPSFIGYWGNAIRRARASIPDASASVLLSAHSLPQRFRDAGDPYPEILRETANAIASAGGLDRWSFTFQSAGNTTEPWLGPDIVEVMEQWKAKGATTQLVASFGFVFDHLEVLYDLDIVVKAEAERRGIAYHRVPEPNDSNEIIQALAHVARARPFQPTPITTAVAPPAH
jgi:protoporphyrin/coproporphyrin ferrochelatase